MDRKTRGHHPRTVKTTGGILRLGQNLFHDGRNSFCQRDKSIH